VSEQLGALDDPGDAAAAGGAEGDPVEETSPGTTSRRKRYVLEDMGFDEVPKKYRRFYRKWNGPDDVLGPNEAFCPVCKIVIRSARELRPGDRLYCMACMTRLTVVEGEDGRLEARVVY
jgi:hypothetical protein